MTPSTNAGGVFGYDVEEKKKEIEKITQEVREELMNKWKKTYANAQIFPAAIESMHPEAVDFLLNFKLVSVYDAIAKQAGLDSVGRNFLPEIVWQIAQSKNWNALDQMLEEKIQLVHSVHVMVANLLQENIVSKIKVLSEKPYAKKIVSSSGVSKKEVQLAIADALLKYPEIAQQIVTSESIKLQFSPILMRPSIKNWISDFHGAMGAGKHSPIDRGNFLFHSENAKKLNAIDRQKLGMILKSLDEQTPLKIDEHGPAVVFEVVPTAKNEQIQLPANNQMIQSEDVLPERDVFASRSLPEREISVPKIPTAIAPKAPIKEPVSMSEKAESFFSVPNSKPPIGSEHFNEQKVVEVEKKEIPLPKEIFAPANVQAPIQNIATISPATAVRTVEQQSVQKTPISQPSVEKNPAAPTQNDPNFMSDDMLYQMMQERAQKNVVKSKNNLSGKISFSSPQKFAVEKEKKSVMGKPVAAPVQKQPEQKQTVQAHPDPKQSMLKTASINSQKSSPFHIKPSSGSYVHNLSEPKVEKNMVDLRG